LEDSSQTKEISSFYLKEIFFLAQRSFLFMSRA